MNCLWLMLVFHVLDSALSAIYLMGRRRDDACGSRDV